METHKFVVLQVTMEIVEQVPVGWTKDQIEFYKNESSSCANNTGRTIARVLERASADGENCLCHRLKVAYVRDAKAEDVERDGL